MKKMSFLSTCTVFSLCLVFLLFGTGTASAQEKGFYVGIDAGATWVKEALDFVEDGLKVRGNMDTGYGLAGTVGYDFGLVRLEAELSYFKSDIDSVKFGSTKYSVSGDISTTSLMANVLFDYENSSRFTPYVGAGLGYARVNVKGRTQVGSWGEYYRWNDSDNVWAYQGIIGVSYALTEQLALNMSYRYYVAKGVKVKGSYGDNLFGETSSSAEIDYKSQSLLAGVRWYF